MKNKNIDLKSITGSPYFVAVLLFLVIALVVAGIGYFISNISATKNEIVEVRKSYAANLQEIADLEELRAENEKAKQQLAAFDAVLPAEQGDIYIEQEKLQEAAENFGLTVTAMEAPVKSIASTVEIAFPITVTGSYANIVDFMKYVTTLEAMHRIDTLNISRAESSENAEEYSAILTVVVLSEPSAEDLAEVVAEAAATAPTTATDTTAAS